MIESGFRQGLSKWMKTWGVFWQSIETSTNPGMPDGYYCYQGRSGWLELKHLKEIPKRANTPLFKSLNHGLRVEQVVWFEVSLAHGVRVDILCKFERRMFLVPGFMAEQFNSMTWDWLQQYEVTKEDLHRHVTGL
jgi:hypothetical protein